MSTPFIPKVGQRVCVKPSDNPNSLTYEVQHLVGTVAELEPDYVLRTYPNGGKATEGKYAVPYERRGAIVKFGNLPARYRIPLSELVPV